MGSNPSKTDILGLSNQEKKIIANIWKMLDPEISKLGVSLFIQFFSDYPEHTKYFSFSLNDTFNLDKSPLLKLHAVRVMAELTFCVANLHRDETVIYHLRRNGIRHRERHITKQAYDDLRRTFLKVLCIQLEARFTFDMAEIMNKALKILFNVITDVNDGIICTCQKRPIGSQPSTSRA